MYCGDWFECRDHVVPISMMRVYRDYRHNETVPCCNLCNKLAGNFPATSVADKAIHLTRRYEVKFKKILQLPVWRRDEMGYLKGSLRRRIKSNEQLRKLLRAKLLNLDLVTCGFAAVPIDKTL